MLERYGSLELMVKKKREHDFSVTAFRIAQEATGQPQPEKPLDGKNPHAVALGRLGGLKGGKARSEKLTASQRQDIAKKAAMKRWHNA